MDRQKTAASSVSAHTFAYSGLNLVSETIPGGAGSPSTLTRQYDSLGRTVATALSAVSDPDPDYSVSYGYDTLGRFAAITPSVLPARSATALQAGSVSISGEYSYLPASDLLSGLTVGGIGDPALSVSRSYEDHRNLLTQVKNSIGTDTISQYDYANDAGGRRTSIKHSGSAFETGPAFNKYDYNSRSEVIVGDKFWGTNPEDTSDPVLGQGFAYAYDNIGNRTASSRDYKENYKEN